jgi:hypothetical protein
VDRGLDLACAMLKAGIANKVFVKKRPQALINIGLAGKSCLGAFAGGLPKVM